MGFTIFLLKKFRYKRRQAVAIDHALMSHPPGELNGDDRRKELDGRRDEVELGTGQDLYHELRG